MRVMYTVRGGLMVGLMVSLAWSAQADMSTEQAVQALLGKEAAQSANTWPLAEQGTGRITPSVPATRMTDDNRTTMVVPRGATLAVLLAPVLRQTQLPKQEVFKAFVALNPQAFLQSNPNRLMAGATVRMFSEADVARLQGHAPSASPEARRGWVRFP